jgi:hypothetical protein
MSFEKRLLSILWAGVLALLILMVGQLMWGALLLTNLTVSPKIPWSAVIMAGVLWLMWQFLGGRWWPRGTAEARPARLPCLQPSLGLGSCGRCVFDRGAERALDYSF